MGVAKFDDGTPQNPKLVAAGPTCCWLWFCGVLYSRRALTDGFIPRLVVPSLVIGLHTPYKHATRLVEVGLWHDAVGGYQIHDYLDWNPTKAAIGAYRKADRDRKHGKHGIRAESELPIQAESSGNPNDAANVRGTHAGAKSKSESESKDPVFDLELKDPRSRSAQDNSPANDPPVWRSPAEKNAPGLHDGRDARIHGCHAFCGRLCVSLGLDADFQQRLGTADARARLHAWYPSVLARYDGLELGDDMFVFWRNEFAAWVGTVTTKPTETRESRTLAAARRTSLTRGELP